MSILYSYRLVYTTVKVIVFSFTVFLIFFSFTSQAYSLTTNNDPSHIDKISTHSKDSFGSLSRSIVDEDNKNDNNDEKDDDDD